MDGDALGFFDLGEGPHPKGGKAERTRAGGLWRGAKVPGKDSNPLKGKWGETFRWEEKQNQQKKACVKCLFSESPKPLQ